MTAELTQVLWELAKGTNQEIRNGQKERNGGFEVVRLQTDLGKKALEKGVKFFGNGKKPEHNQGNGPIEAIIPSDLTFVVKLATREYEYLQNSGGSEEEIEDLTFWLGKTLCDLRKIS